jgi:DeoR family transcriptional regulator of aga operon
MNKHERQGTLLDALAAREHLRLEEIVELLGASPATVRRDLEDLASQQLLVRTRGGAAAITGLHDLPVRYRGARNATQKVRIARAAGQLIASGAIVGLNGGTTTAAVAHEIGLRADLVSTPQRPGVTVVTNALNVAYDLVVRPHVRIIMPGGTARTQSFELVGPTAGRTMEDINLDLAILGVDALSPHDGASANNEGEAEINRVFAARAQRVVIVADSSKLGQVALARICHTEAIDTLITDEGMSAHDSAAFEALGVAVVLA